MRTRSQVTATASTPTPPTDGGALKPSEAAKTDIIASQRASQRVTRAADMTAEEGDLVTVSKGKENFSPVAYNTFEVGPLSIEGRVRGGESYDQAYARLSLVLETLFEAEFDIKLQSYREHIVRSRAT